MPYAETTDVPVDRSRTEIETTLRKHGCSAVMTLWDDDEEFAGIQFRVPVGDGAKRMIRFRIDLPELSTFARASNNRGRSKDQQHRAWEQACRARWRGLLLCIKAKLEAVETGMETWDEAFLAQIVMPDGRAVGQLIVPMVQQAYMTGEMPQLDRMLPAHGEE